MLMSHELFVQLDSVCLFACSSTGTLQHFASVVGGVCVL